MIESLQDKLYQLENKHAKGAKRHTNIRQELMGEKFAKTFFKVLVRHTMQYQAIYELYTDDNKSKNSSNPRDFLKSAIKTMKNSTPRKLPPLILLKLLAKFLTKRNI